MLFKKVPRRDGYIDPRETTFEYLQRSARESAIQRCHWLEEWFRRIPASIQPGIKTRLMDERHFHSTLFELQVYGILQNLGCDVVYEPELSGTEKRLDFVARHEHEEFWVEATVCGYRRGVLAGSAAEDDVVKKIRENLQNLHSDIHLKARGALQKTLSKTDAVEPFKQLLRQRSSDYVRDVYSRGGMEHAPSAEISEGDWVLRGFLAPVPTGRYVGQVWGPARTEMCDGGTPVFEAVEKKAHKWRKHDFHDAPFVLAVNACHSEFFWHDIESALYEDTIPGRGRFRGSLSNVSGVIVFDHAVLGNEIGARVQLYENSGAAIPTCLRPCLTEQRLDTLLGIDVS